MTGSLTFISKLQLLEYIFEKRVFRSYADCLAFAIDYDRSNLLINNPIEMNDQRLILEWFIEAYGIEKAIESILSAHPQLQLDKELPSVVPPEKGIVKKYMEASRVIWEKFSPYIGNFHLDADYLNSVYLPELYVDVAPDNPDQIAAPFPKLESLRDHLPAYVPSDALFMQVAPPAKGEQEAENNDKKADTRPRVPASAQQDAQLDFKQWIEAGHHALVLGLPGCGKSVFIRHLFYELCLDAERSLDGQMIVCPFFLHASKLEVATANKAVNALSVQRLIHAALAQCGISDERISSKDKKHLCDFLTSSHLPGRLVFLIDGLDENPQLISDLEAFMRANRGLPSVQLIATMRPRAGYPSNSLYRVFDLPGFSDLAKLQDYVSKVAGLLVKQGTPFDVDAFMAALIASSLNGSSKQNPLLLTMLLLIFALDQKRFPEQPIEICERMLRMVLGDWSVERKKQQTLTGQPQEIDVSRLVGYAARLAAGALEIQFPCGHQQVARVKGPRADDTVEFDFAPSRLSNKQINDMAEDPGLRDEWKRGILRLVESGLLVREADNHYCFVHRVFLDYLAAKFYYYKLADLDQAHDAIQSRIGCVSLHEMLTLWCAHYLEQPSDEQKQLELCQRLLHSHFGAASWLGAALARGLLTESVFDAWLDYVTTQSRVRWPLDQAYHAQSWLTAPPSPRHRRIANAAQRAAQDAGRFVDWLRLLQFALPCLLKIQMGPSEFEAAEGEVPPPMFPPAVFPEIAAVVTAIETAEDELRYARSRVLCSVDPLWPRQPVELTLLNAWPSLRRLGGLKLQAAANLGATRQELVKLTRWIFDPSAVSASIASRIAGDFYKETFALSMLGAIADSAAWPIELPQQLHAKVASAWSAEWMTSLLVRFLELAPQLQPEMLAKNLPEEERVRVLKDLKKKFYLLPTLWFSGWYLPFARAADQYERPAEFAQAVVERWLSSSLGYPPAQGSMIPAHLYDPQVATLLQLLLPRYWVERSGMTSVLEAWDGFLPGWLEPWMCQEVASAGRHCAAVLLAQLRTGGVDGSEQAALLSATAAAIRFRQEQEVQPEEDADKGSGRQIFRLALEPLAPHWRAFVCHLAGVSTEEQRALLVQVAQHPEDLSGPLRQGMKYLIGGSVALSDGNVLTLDSLAQEAGVPPPNWLDEA